MRRSGWSGAAHLGILVPVGAVAQLGEHLVCIQGVEGSNPFRSMQALFAAFRPPFRPPAERALDQLADPIELRLTVSRP